MRRGILLAMTLGQLNLSLAASIPLASDPANYLSTCSLLTISGYVDSSYNYLLRSNRFISHVYNRENDITENGFTLQQAAFTFSVIPETGLGGLFNIVGGRDAYSISPSGLNPNVFKASDIGVAIPEAYAMYAYKEYIFYAGEMLSLAGIEQFDYGLDMNFSRSILDGYAQPGTHVGLRYADQFNDKWRLIAGINNGWSSVKQSGRFDTMEIATQYTADKLTATIDGYIGRQPIRDNSTEGPWSNRYLIDIYGTYTINRKINVAMNYDYAIQTEAVLAQQILGRADWQALALYSTYYFTDQVRSTVRAEVFNDGDGARTGVRQNWKEVTFTLAYDVTKHLMLRAETRHDFTNVNAFLDKEGIGTANNQQSYALEAYYAFSI